MSAPRFLPALANDRSWIGDNKALDTERAMQQWGALRALVDDHIAPVVELQPEPWTPAMTFTRDLGLVTAGGIVPLMPSSSRGPFEAPPAHRRIRELGAPLVDVADPLRLDGGNVLADTHGRLLVGVTSSAPDPAFVAAVRVLEQVTNRPPFRVPLVGGRFPHVDMAVCDLNGAGWLVYPEALPGFDLADPAWDELFLGLPVIAASERDGELLGCNLIVGTDTAIGPEISHGLRQGIEQVGVRYLGTPLSELRKAGGGAHCLSLELPAHRDGASHESPRPLHRAANEGS